MHLMVKPSIVTNPLLKMTINHKQDLTSDCVFPELFCSLLPNLQAIIINFIVPTPEVQTHPHPPSSLLIRR